MYLRGIVGEEVNLLHAQEGQGRDPVLKAFSVDTVQGRRPHAQGHLHVSASLAALDHLKEEVKRPVSRRVLTYVQGVMRGKSGPEYRGVLCCVQRGCKKRLSVKKGCFALGGGTFGGRDRRRGK